MDIEFSSRFVMDVAVAIFSGTILLMALAVFMHFGIRWRDHELPGIRAMGSSVSQFATSLFSFLTRVTGLQWLYREGKAMFVSAKEQIDQRRADLIPDFALGIEPPPMSFWEQEIDYRSAKRFRIERIGRHQLARLVIADYPGDKSAGRIVVSGRPRSVTRLPKEVVTGDIGDQELLELASEKLAVA